MKTPETENRSRGGKHLQPTEVLNGPESLLALATVLVAILLAAAAAAGFLALRETAEMDRLVDTSTKLRAEVDRLSILVLDAQLGTRGYLISQSPDELESYRTAARDAGAMATELRTRPEDGARLAPLLDAVDRQLAFRRQLIETAQTQGLEAARVMAATGEGKRGAERIRAIRDEILRESAASLETRHASLSRMQSRAVTIQGVVTFLAIGLLIVTLVAVHYRLEAERRMRQTLARKSAEIDEAQRLAKVGTWSWDSTTGTVAWSDQLFQIFGLPPGGDPPSWEMHPRLYAPESFVRLESAVRRCLETGAPYELDLVGIRANGDSAHMRIWGRAEPAVNGRITRLYGSAQDTTDTWLHLEREREMRRQAQIAEKAKAQFLAVMSHEIRTPLNAILGFAELLANRRLGREEEEFIRTIRESGHALLRIIDDILDYSRLSSGRFEIEGGTYAPRAVAEGVRALLAPSAHDRGLDVVVECETEVPEFAAGDGGRIRQVLLNLVSNGIKFSEAGSVHIGIERRRRSGERDALIYTVRDSGIGIAPEKLAEIFEPFAQADSSISRRYGGTGLGLAIAKELVGAMGGTMSATSTPGAGTAFTFELALEEAAPPAPNAGDAGQPPDASFAEIHPLRILVAEDDAVNLRLCLLMLKRLGYSECATATDGRQAVETWEDVNPDVILMDLHMPGTGGVQATREIRRLEALKGVQAPVFISALTADVMPEERAECALAGMNDHLTKPLHVTRLAAILRAASAARFGER